MTNENLIPFDQRTEEEQRKIRSAGGKASGKTRRRKADFRRTLNLLLTAKLDDSAYKAFLENLGMESTLEAEMLMAQIKAAAEGNTKAAYFVAQYAGQSAQTEADDQEQRIRTDRAKRVRDQEVGGEDQGEASIQSFLAATRPRDEDLAAMFEGERDGGEGEETSRI